MGGIARPRSIGRDPLRSPLSRAQAAPVSALHHKRRSRRDAFHESDTLPHPCMAGTKQRHYV